MKKKIIILLSIIIVLILAILLLIPKKKSETETKYNDVKVSTQTITNTLTSTGEVTSDTVIEYLNTYKYFSAIYYEVGDYVKKGSTIVKYTNGTYYKAPCDLVITSYNVPDSKEKIKSNNYIEYKGLTDLKMSISIDESDINKIKNNQTVTITLNYDETKTYEGKITYINNIGSYSSSGTKYTAEVSFTNDGNIKLGMSCSASIEIEKSENVIAVPIEAVQTRGTEKYVLVVDSNNETTEAIITTGISNSAYVEVKSGLSGDETIRMISTSSEDTNMFNRGNRNFDFGDMERPSGDFKPNDNGGRRDQ